MRLSSHLFIAATLLTMTSALACAETPDTTQFDPMKMWSCPQPDGTVLYTNKDKAGCTLMTLKPLSVVPSLDNMPTYRSPHATAPAYDLPPYLGYPGGMAQRVTPGWAQDWYASIAPSGSVQAETCSLYGEWLNLVQKTRGGFFFGTDPSYGGDLTGRNQRGASYSFYDNARYHALSRIFGTGFVPVGCQ